MEKDYCINYDGAKIQFTLVRSHRKTIGITITKDGDIKVAAPIRTTEKQVIEIVHKKASWIIKKLEEISKSQLKPINDKKYSNGTLILFLGKEYILSICRERGLHKPEVKLNTDYLNIILPEDSITDEILIKVVLRKWYISQFEVIIRERIARYSAIVGVSPSKVTIREQKTRWGSCSTKGNINLNWRIVMAPLDVLDYVIVHELCHMRRMDHSTKFWGIVESILPGFAESRKWLKTNGSKLVL
jgi:Predicted metal-dependent hydrolase